MREQRAARSRMTLACPHWQMSRLCYSSCVAQTRAHAQTLSHHNFCHINREAKPHSKSVSLIGRVRRSACRLAPRRPPRSLPHGSLHCAQASATLALLLRAGHWCRYEEPSHESLTKAPHQHSETRSNKTCKAAPKLQLHPNKTNSPTNAQGKQGGERDTSHD